MRTIAGDEAVLAQIRRFAEAGFGVVDFVNSHPELAHREFECAAHLSGLLESAGYRIERGVAGMSTAFTATLDGALPGDTVGIVAMYDAVPLVAPSGDIIPTHACGHGQIAGGVATAALAFAALRDELAGRIVIVGCPADEIHAPETRARGGGKALTAQAGVWDEMDYALYTHPEFIDTVSLASRWMQRQRIHVSGARTLKPASETPGSLKLLHAVSSYVADADPWNIMLERLVVDGDVEERTGLVSDATFLVFAETERELDELIGDLRERMPEGAWTSGPKVRGVQPHPAVTEAVAETFAVMGKEFVADPPALPFATDFGNISHRVPSGLIGVGAPGGWAFHTVEGREQFAAEGARAVAVEIASVLALTAVRLSRPAS